MPREKNLLTRNKLAENIRQEIKENKGIELTKEEILSVLQAEEEEVLMAMAQNQSIKYAWGTIYGEEVAPVRLRGYYVEMPSAKKNGGYSQYKNGKPGISWSRAAKQCEKIPPIEYFSQPEHKYTSEARRFRQLNNLEELPEYTGLTEEKIQEICKKADQLEFESLSKTKQSRKLRDNKWNQQNQDALHQVWRETGYKPIGSLEEEFESGDTITWYLSRYDETKPSPNRLDFIRRVIDIAIERDLIDKHKDLFDLEKQLQEEVKRDGLEEFEHKLFKTPFKDNILTLKIDPDRDPWGEMNRKQQMAIELAKKNKAALENYSVQFSDILDEWWETEKDVLRNDLLNQEIIKNEQIDDLEG